MVNHNMNLYIANTSHVVELCSQMIKDIKGKKAINA